MILTKTQSKVMQLFTSQIKELFTIRLVSRMLSMQVSLAHRSIQPLIKNKLLMRNKQNYLSLDYTRNHGILAYVEYLRRDEFLSKAKNSIISQFANDINDEFSEDCYILILFGSAIISNKPRDVDIILIVENQNKVETTERFIANISNKYSASFHTIVISFESAYEMLGKRNQANIMNEMLNKHVLLYGAEIFFRILKKGREL